MHCHFAYGGHWHIIQQAAFRENVIYIVPYMNCKHLVGFPIERVATAVLERLAGSSVICVDCGNFA